jgi:hypothetical protein
VGRVEAADVEGGIGFGIAFVLRLFQHLGKGAVLLLHLGQDVVAGAVENTIDAADLIAGERLAQRLDDRDTSRHGRLELEGHGARFRQARQLGAVLGQQGLVGRHDVLAGLQRRRTRGARHALLAADQLDEHIDAGIGRQALGLFEPGNARGVTLRFFWRERALTPTMVMSRPKVSARRAPCSWMSCTNPAPTVPRPAMPSFNGWLMRTKINAMPFAE